MKKYHISSRIIHWIMAILIIFLIALGIYMTDFVDREAENRIKIYSLHKSLGVMVLFLIFIRIINKIFYQAPELPKTFKQYEILLSKITHFILYLLMIIVPLSGYLMSNSYGYPVSFFAIQMPFLLQQNLDLAKIFAEIHEVSAFTMLGVVSLHILAVLKHIFFDKQKDFLKRMI